MRDPPWCVTNLTSIPHNHPNPQTHTRTTARRARSRPSQRSLCLLACTEPRGRPQRPPWRPTQKRPPPAIAYIRFVVQVVIGRSTFISAAFDLNPLDASFHDETSSILNLLTNFPVESSARVETAQTNETRPNFPMAILVPASLCALVLPLRTRPPKLGRWAGLGTLSTPGLNAQGL